MPVSAEQIYQFVRNKNLNSNITGIPEPMQKESGQNYLKRLAAFEALKPYIIPQIEVQEAFPLDTSKMQYARDIYNTLISDQKLITEHGLAHLNQTIPSPTANVSYNNYLKILDSNPLLNKNPYQPIAEYADKFVPRKLFSKDPAVWKDPQQLDKMKKFVAKMNVAWIVEDREGNPVLRNLSDMMENVSYKIYQKLRDYTVSVELGRIIAKQIDQMSLSPELEQYFIDALVKNINLINSDMSLFFEGVMESLETTESEGLRIYLTSISNKRPLLISLFKICREMATKGFQAVYQADQKFLDEILPDMIRTARPGLSLHGPVDDPNKPGILITTSSGGGCHKVITQNASKELIAQEIPNAVINETDLTQVDPIYQLIGIPHCDFYTYIAQQCGSFEARNLLRKLDDIYNLHFKAPFSFSQMRDAVAYCNTKFRVDTVYSTQHYAEDLLFVPANANIVFQVCDFGHVGKLEELANRINSLKPTGKVTFLIPSATCLEPLNQQKIKHDEKFILVEYPTRILSASETAADFEKIIEKEKLFKTDEKDVTRCAIVMGGQGCGDLIREYLDKLEIEIQQQGIPADKKFEFLVVCGNNTGLMNELKEKYKDFFSMLPPNIIIKVCGRVENAQLIAYNKNAVLITKPGGGTIAECIENKIQTLVHYDARLNWEHGNAKEIEVQELGKILIGREEKGQKVTMKDVNLLSEITLAEQQRNKRLQLASALEQALSIEVKCLKTSIQQYKEQQASTEKASYHATEQERENIQHEVEKVIPRLENLKSKRADSKTLAFEINKLTELNKDYKLYLTNPDEVRYKALQIHLKLINAFLETCDKKTSQSVVTRRINRR